jgi:hypothetical protein
MQLGLLEQRVLAFELLTNPMHDNDAHAPDSCILGTSAGSVRSGGPAAAVVGGAAGAAAGPLGAAAVSLLIPGVGPVISSSVSPPHAVLLVGLQGPRKAEGDDRATPAHRLGPLGLIQRGTGTAGRKE